MSNAFYMEESMQRKECRGYLTYQENLLWGLLIVDVAVYSLYLFYFPEPNSIGHIAAAMYTLIFGSMITQSMITARTRNHVQDERDELIRLRGYRAGYNAFVCFVVIGLGILWMDTRIGHLQTERMAIHVLSVMFGMLVLADVVRIVTQLIAYRRAI